MLVTVNRAELLSELAVMLGIVERRASIPILSHILLRADEEGLHLLAATDLDVSLTSLCDGEVGKAGSIAVPARKFLDICKAVAGDDVRLHAEREQIEIVSGAASFKIRGRQADDFPNIADVQGDPFVMPFRVFASMVSKVFFAISTEESRFQLSGALFRFKEDGATMAATDGHRLAVVESRIEGMAEGGDVIIPRKALLELQRFRGEDLSLRRGEHHLSFQIGRKRLICRILEGTFPDFERIIARDLDKSIEVDRKWLAGMVQRIALMTGERARAIKVELKENQLVLSSANPDLGEAAEELGVEYSGEPVAIGLNPDYLQQVFAAIETERVRLDLKDAQAQCVIQPVNGTETRCLCIVMPIRL